ncbi:MAG TPA: hypothetical protein VFD07_04480 [Candidatus Krumholzibacteria bacterium]|nr:hypothetical protein [Candidatus Krumholzibacteria bacterium]
MRASRAWWTSLAVAGMVALACGREPVANPESAASPTPIEGAADSVRRENPMTMKTIEQVQEEHTPTLMSLNGVVGTFIGVTADDRPCIKVMVVRRTRELEGSIPSQLEGYPVEIFESGEIRPLSKSQ